MISQPRNFDSQSQAQAGFSVRLACRMGTLTGPTAGLAPGYVQGNLAVLPADIADDFLRFAQANPKPCPILGVTDAGSWSVPALGADLDLRTDFPRYRLWQNGELIAEPTDVRDFWRSDLVGFVIGCSYSFE